jgi:cytoskeletal protein CcmA (bactofilin family)
MILARRREGAKRVWELDRKPKFQTTLLIEHGQSGFALPSVLMLVTVLTLVAMSVLLMQHLRYLQAVSDVARAKAELAAQSGIALAASQREFREDPLLVSFSDSSSASIRTVPWGLLKLAVVEGVSGRMRSTRVALLGAAPPSSYRNAICFGGSSRQLIMTGTTSVAGDVVVGPMGVAVGALPGAARPPRLPVAGNVVRNPQVSSPALDGELLERSFAPFVAFLKGNLPAGIERAPIGDLTGSSHRISDSTECLVWNGGSVSALNVSRHSKPLRVYVLGSLSFASNAAVEGAVAFYASGSVQIEAGARIDNAVIMSGDSIVVESGVSMRGQLIAPRVLVKTSSAFAYPSVICAYGSIEDGKQSLELSAGCRCEGLVCFIRGANAHQSNSHDVQHLAVVDRDATVIGALYADGPVTLDGTVIGSAIVRDLYFYEAPTSYFGWLRSARIDRQKLPEGFALPQAFGEGKGEVVVWM